MVSYSCLVGYSGRVARTRDEAARRRVLDSARDLVRKLGPHAVTVDEIASADLIVMIATAGQDAKAGSLIGEACNAHRVMTTGLVLGTAVATDEQLSKTLGQLRPHSIMLVAGGDEDYIEDMLIALRA